MTGTILHRKDAHKTRPFQSDETGGTFRLYDSENEQVKKTIVRRFLSFKEKYTLHSKQEALLAMSLFMKEMESDTILYQPWFRRVMLEQCSEAKAALEGVKWPEVGQTETVEWKMDPVGVALEHRKYCLAGLTENEVDEAPPMRFPGDYFPRILCESKNRDNVTIGSFRKMLHLDEIEAFVLLRKMPEHAYTGSLTAISRLRIAEGAAALCSGTTLSFWPRMAANNEYISII